MDEKRGAPAWFFWGIFTFILLFIIACQALMIADPREPGSMVRTSPEAYFTAHAVEPYPNLRDASEGFIYPSDTDQYGFMLSAKTDDSPHKVIDYYSKCYPKSKITQSADSLTLKTVTPRGDDLFIKADGNELYFQVSVHAQRAHKAASR